MNVDTQDYVPHDITLFGLQAVDLSHKANRELLYQKVFEANIHDIWSQRC